VQCSTGQGRTGHGRQDIRSNVYEGGEQEEEEAEDSRKHRHTVDSIERK
jgi:hypothetical protein